MSIEENKRVVAEYYECLNTRDATRIGTLFTEDFVWLLPVKCSALRAMAQPRNKAETIVRCQAIFDSMSQDPQMEPFAWTAEGDRVTVESEGHIVWNNGKSFDNQYHHAFVLRDGKIAKCTEYLDFMLVWEEHPLVKRPA